ncbi:hypothetical protein I35_2812 [Burkholderia cenocepacia H111]|nr:hypothetical protein I35_2812 [Burkholderia cenocepacia H111]
MRVSNGKRNAARERRALALLILKQDESCFVAHTSRSKRVSTSTATRMLSRCA